MSAGLPRVIAFYLPQFQPTVENDGWWGKGFTEWTLVSAATPLFSGHRQPRRPGELGYYDLRVEETRQAQADLAEAHGISGFCYYHYWSLGRRLLGRVLDEVRSTGLPDTPFCLNWANHPWSRRWDGSTNELLLDQEYSPEDDLAHIRWLCGVFEDARYIRVGDRPLLLIHWAHHLPDIQRTLETWRSEAKRLGAGDLYLCRVERTEDRGVDPRPLGFDASVQWEPQKISLGRRRTVPAELGLAGSASSSPELKANQVFTYEEWVDTLTSRPPPAYPHHPVVCPGWDNRARRPYGGARVVIGADPLAYRRWLVHAVETQKHKDPGLVFVNAWNEWSEGAYLEPDSDFGRGFLQAQLGL